MIPFLLIAALLLLQSCCAPLRCPEGQAGTRALDPVIEKIEKFKEKNGKYPVLLDDIEKGLGVRMERELWAACPKCGDFKYRTDSFGFLMEFRYNRMGKNTCAFDTETMHWNCRGEY